MKARSITTCASFASSLSFSSAAAAVAVAALLALSLSLSVGVVVASAPASSVVLNDEAAAIRANSPQFLDDNDEFNTNIDDDDDDEPPYESSIDKLRSSQAQQGRKHANFTESLFPPQNASSFLDSILMLREETQMGSATLLGVDLTGDIIAPSALRRELQAENPYDLFKPLSCNADVESAPCSSWSSIVETIVPGSPAVIPCGQCVSLDVPDGTTIDLPDGLDVQGLLSIPPNKKVNISTTALYVQGVLRIRDTNAVSPDNWSVTFHFYGTESKRFVPHADNLAACDSSPYANMCDNAGTKPFIVAGGMLDVQAWPDASCPSWSYIEDVVYEDMSVPDLDGPSQPAEPGCPRAFSDADFEQGGSGDGTGVGYLGVNGWKSHLGAVHAVQTEEEEGGGTNSYLRVSNRARTWQGPLFDLSSIKKCLVPDQDYTFAAKIRLTKEGGGTTDCSTGNNNNCPRFVTQSRPGDDSSPVTYVKRSMSVTEGTSTTDGQWFVLTGVFAFTAAEADPASIYVTLAIDGPEPGVVIDVDDVYVGLPHVEQYATDPNTACGDLFLADGAADGYFDPPRYPYPIYNSRSTSRQIQVLTEDDGTNSFYRLADRPQEYESLAVPLLPGCVRGGARYDVSLRARIHDAGQYDDVKVQFIGGSTDTIKCPDVMGGGRGWVWCNVSVTFDDIDEANAATSPLYFRLNTGFASGTGSNDVVLDVDYDDISIKLSHGPVKTLVVPAEAAGCWGAGSEVMVTSHSDNWNAEQLAVIAGASVRADDPTKADLVLESYVVRPTTRADDDMQATEVALLTRNVRFTTEREVANVGAYLKVLHTTNVPQVLSGVEIFGFGQAPPSNRRAVHVDRCADVSGSYVSKNVVREAGFDGIVLQGTHNVTVLENVAYDTLGYAFVTNDGKEWDNRFEFNLGALTRSGADGSSTATFLVRCMKNSYVGNVAAGSRRRGWFFDIEGSVRSDSAGLPGSNSSPLNEKEGDFRDNVAHSNDDWNVFFDKTLTSGSNPIYGFRIYKGKDYGLYVRGRYVKFVGLYVSDHAYEAIDLNYCDSCELRDADIIGFSDTYRDQVMASDYWHMCIDASTVQNRMIGIEMKHFADDKKHISPGVTFENVRFSRFADSGCARPVTLIIEKHRRMPHFDYFNQMSGVLNLDGGNFLIDFCGAESIEVQDVLFTDLDSSLHPDGPGSYVGPSAIVSDHPWMKGFAQGQCLDIIDRCASYCEGACLRFVNFRVDAYGTEDVTLEVTDAVTGKSIEIGGNFYYSWSSNGVPNVKDNTYINYDLRVYSVPLPDSTFTARFLKNGQPHWPTFVEKEYEPDPSCGGATEGSVTILEPPLGPTECDGELIPNGDVESGNYTHWYHSGGGVTPVAGAGVNGSYAIVSDERSQYWHGVAMYVDTRCVKLNAGREYELTADVRLEDATGSEWICDPDSKADPAGCPRFTVEGRFWNPTSLAYSSRYYYHAADVVRPYNLGGYTHIHGTFVMPTDFVTADSVFVYITNTDKNAAIFLDNVSLKLLQTPTRTEDGCVGNEFVVNGNFEMFPTTQYWDTRKHDYTNGGKITITSPGAGNSQQALLITERTNKYQGPGQYLNPACFDQGGEYQVLTRFKLSKDTIGPIICDPNLSNGLDTSCPVVTIKTWTGDLATSTIKYKKIGTVTNPGSETDWGTIHGTFTPTEEMLNAFRMYVYVEYPGVGVDIAIDDFSIKPYSLDCANVLTNGDFESGDFRGWTQYPTSTGSPGVYSPGANGTSYALRYSGRDDRSWGPEQELERACMGQDEQYILEAKFRLDYGNGTEFHCDPNIIFGGEMCPVAAIVSTQSTGTTEREVAAVVGGADADGWYYITGIFQIYAMDLSSDRIVLRFMYAPAGVDMIIDEVVMTKTV